MAQWNSYCGKILHIKCQDFVNMKNIVGKGGEGDELKITQAMCIFIICIEND